MSKSFDDQSDPRGIDLPLEKDQLFTKAEEETLKKFFSSISKENYLISIFMNLAAQKISETRKTDETYGVSDLLVDGEFLKNIEAVKNVQSPTPGEET